MIPDLTKIHNLGIKIMKKYKKSKSIWTKLTKINSKHQKALKIYGSYQC